MHTTPDIFLKGYAPIHLACDRGHLEVVRLLLSRGVNRDIKVILQLFSYG